MNRLYSNIFAKGWPVMTILERGPGVVPADWVSGPQQGEWTYQDYTKIPEDGKRYEVVSGVLYMSPAPNINHQRIVGRLFFHLTNQITFGGHGEVFIAPCDVEVSYKTVVQPDVFVILNEHLDRLTDSRVFGAPDLVVEVASPSTARHDLHGKLVAYASAGVLEYWIVNPNAQTVELLVLEGADYRSKGIFAGTDIPPSTIVPNLPVTVEQFFR